jgi:hypothetical protein
MPSPGYALGRNGDGAVVSGPVAERLARCTALRDGAAYDQMPDIPRVERSSEMPRTTTPPHETAVASGLDDEGEGELAPEVIARVLKACAEHDISTDTGVGEALEQLSDAIAGRGGDAGVPTGRVGAQDDEPLDLDRETIEKIVRHFERHGYGPGALKQLDHDLSNEPAEDDADPVPAFLKGREGELERIAEPLDRHSASDMHELYGAIDQMHEEARARMRELGKFDAPVRTRAAGSGERWHPGKGEPPGTGLPHPAGTVHPPGSLIPSERHKPQGATDRMPRMKVRAFHRTIGVRKRDLPRVLG